MLKLIMTQESEVSLQVGQSSFHEAFGMGIDMGGTQTRWAIADPSGCIKAEGRAEGASALQLASSSGRAALFDLFRKIERDASVLFGGEIKIGSLQAGLTGFGGDASEVKALLARVFGLEVSAISISNDIEIAYLDCFDPGQGYLVYAGTGSIAAYIDSEGRFYRAGGHGSILDDAGSGYWISREALRHIWREEDMMPGSWRASPMACLLFEAIGGSDWSASREFIYQRTRGEIGKLAIAVAAAAEHDPVARQILENAGMELARLANALCQRYGDKPIALSGRVQELHPMISASMRRHLQGSSSMTLCQNRGHHSAARIAALRLL